MTKIIYLACPYTHPDPVIRNDRAELASLAAANIMEGFKHAVYSPITHGHRVHEHLQRKGDHAFWMNQCLPILHRCEELWLLPLEGWDKSRGVEDELKFCWMNRIQTRMIVSLPGFDQRLTLPPQDMLSAWQHVMLPNLATSSN